MSAPTPEQLGLPWKIEDENCFFSHDGMAVADFFGWVTYAQFALQAANTYHEREQMLKSCLVLLESETPSCLELISNLREALKKETK